MNHGSEEDSSVLAATQELGGRVSVRRKSGLVTGTECGSTQMRRCEGTHWRGIRGSWTWQETVHGATWRALALFHRTLALANPLPLLEGHRIAVGICVVRLALGVVYSIAVPMWEAYDEDGHYDYVRYVATRHTLPQEGDPEGEEIWEKFQPPLYYVVGAGAISWIDISDDVRLTVNPFFAAGTGGVNHWIHSESEGFPYRGTVLAVHVVRLLSVVLSVVGVVCTYAVGLTIAPSRRRLAVGAMAVHAFWPQFLFNGSVITNDAPASALGSLTTLVLVRIVERRNGGIHVPILGVVLALSLLTKVNTMALLPIAVFVVISDGIGKFHRSPTRSRLRWCCSALAGCLPVLLAWQMLTGMSYLAIPVVWEADGGLFSKGLLAGVAQLAQSMDLAVLRDAATYAFWSFFALFGWGNIEVETVLYLTYAVLVCVALSGLWLFWIRRRSSVSRKSVALLQWVWVAAFALPLLWAVHEGRPYLAPGRYVLPGMSAASVLLCVGWGEAAWLGRRRLPLTSVVSVGMLILAVVTPFRYIIPAYARPPLVPAADLAELERRVSFNFGDEIELVAYEVDRDQLKPGEAVQITLYWRALAHLKSNYAVCVRLVGPNGETDGADCTYPGRGNYATSLWSMGDIVRDTYRAGVRRRFRAPSFARIDVAVFRYPQEEYLLVADGQGKAIGPSATFGALKVASKEEFAAHVTNPVYDSLSDTVALIGHEVGGSASAGSTLRVKLYWKSIARTDHDYTVFVHLVDEAGELWVQHDGWPRNGSYPTSFWDEGEIVEDEHELALPVQMPSGGYQIRVGMYSLDTMQRLALLDDQTGEIVGDCIMLKEVVIAP